MRVSLGAQRLLSSSSLFRSNAVLGYGISILAFIVALALRFSINNSLPPGFPFLTFFPAVIISAFVAGTRAGVLCAALSFMAVWYWFLGPYGSFSIDFGAALALAFFTFIAAVDISLIAAAARSVNLLQTRQAQLSTIFETVPLGVVMAEFPSGKIVGENGYIAKIFGHPLGHSPDIGSLNDWAGYHEDGSLVEVHEYPLAAMMLRGEKSPSIEVQLERQGGERTWVRILGRPVIDKQGNMIGGVLAYIDIEDEKTTKLALENAVKAKDLLLYEVNHRVKNSLHLVNSFLLLEASKVEDLEAQSAIMAARTKVDLIARVHQLLYESGAHNGVDMRVAVREIVIDLVESAGRSDVDLTMSFSGDLVIHISQASPLVLLINEVVTNALKYGLNSEQPKLTVSVASGSGNIKFMIGDNGPGLPQETTEHKNGLGSQIIKGLAKQMRADLVVESAKSGTKFFLTIPIDTTPSATGVAHQ